MKQYTYNWHQKFSYLRTFILLLFLSNNSHKHFLQDHQESFFMLDSPIENEYAKMLMHTELIIAEIWLTH